MLVALILSVILSICRVQADDRFLRGIAFRYAKAAGISHPIKSYKNAAISGKTCAQLVFEKTKDPKAIFQLTALGPKYTCSWVEPFDRPVQIDSIREFAVATCPNGSCTYLANFTTHIDKVPAKHFKPIEMQSEVDAPHQGFCLQHILEHNLRAEFVEGTTAKAYFWSRKVGDFSECAAIKLLRTDTLKPAEYSRIGFIDDEASCAHLPPEWDFLQDSCSDFRYPKLYKPISFRYKFSHPEALPRITVDSPREPRERAVSL